MPLIARFTSGQVLVLAINLTTGFLILRFLSIGEYAIYILASLLQTVAALGADLGVSQAVVSIGAPIRENKRGFSGLVRSAIGLRRKFFLLAVPIVLAIAYFLLRGDEFGTPVAAAVTVLAIANAWVQQKATIATAVLNAHHDAGGLTRSNAGAALLRLALVPVACGYAPFAVTALLVNLVGATLHARLLQSACEAYVVVAPEARDYTADLLAFVRPLVPGVVYYLAQGHISTFLLALAGTTRAIAEVGALGRLGQVIGVLMLLNGFLVQPYFARVSDRRQFAERAAQVVLALTLGAILVTASAIAAPGAWLAVLGSNYVALSGELVIALIGSYLSVAGAMLYTIVIATRTTRSQWLQIPLGLSGQLAYLMMAGISGTSDALILNLIPAATYLILQIGLLVGVLVAWRTRERLS